MTRTRVPFRAAVLTLAVCSAYPTHAGAQPPSEPPAAGSDSAALARQLSNPIASLVSVPFQLNFDQGVGADEDQRFVMNLQPVMPFTIDKDWNLITRVIVPVVSQPALAPGRGPASGLGDITASFFLSPARGKVFWGIGPVLLLPVGADPVLGTEKWAAGPTFVVLRQTGHWTAGMLANHLWSYAGDATRDAVNQTFLQPFLSYGTGTGYTFTVATETTANWKADPGQRWTVPVQLGVSKVTRLGRRPLSFGVTGGYFVETPGGGPEWKVRTTLTLIFPR